MSMTSHLNEEQMTAWCPACGLYRVARYRASRREFLLGGSFCVEA